MQHQSCTFFPIQFLAMLYGKSLSHSTPSANYLEHLFLLQHPDSPASSGFLDVALHPTCTDRCYSLRLVTM